MDRLDQQPRTLRCASLQQRMIAAAVDLAGWVPAVICIVWVDRHSPRVALDASLCMAILALGCRTYLHGRYGQTLGMLIVGVRLTRLDGGPIDARRALCRSCCDGAVLIGIGFALTVSPTLTGMSSAAVGLGLYRCGTLLMSLATPMKRTWQDLVAGTIMVSDQISSSRRNRPGARSAQPRRYRPASATSHTARCAPASAAAVGDAASGAPAVDATGGEADAACARANSSAR